MKWLSRLFGFIEVRDSGSLAMPPGPLDDSWPPLSFSNAGFRTKARQGQSDGESGEVCCEFASFSSTLLLVETRREPELAYMARPRCRLFLRPRTPRPPSPSDRAAVREEFSDMKELAPSHQ